MRLMGNCRSHLGRENGLQSLVTVLGLPAALLCRHLGRGDPGISCCTVVRSVDIWVKGILFLSVSLRLSSPSSSSFFFLQDRASLCCVALAVLNLTL